MKLKHLTLLFCIWIVLCSAQASCGDETTSDSEYINNEEYDDDTLTSFVRKTYYITGRHWKTDTMTKNDFFIFNFKEAEMQMVYYRDGEKRDKGATTVKYYTDSTVVFTNDNGEATYTINDDTLKIKISKHAYTAVVLNENDVPEDNDNFHEPSDRTWPDAALEWLEDLWYRWFGDSSDE